ncbi:MAG: hypothetical protein AMXMBFR47_09650 [Planctomycetota bacterium]
MKRIVAVFADFAETFLGGRSHLQTEVGGAPLLSHTLRRAARLGDAVDAILLVVSPRDADIAAEFVRLGDHRDVAVAPIDKGDRPRRRLIRAGRIWGLESWRGTPLGTTYFDEFVHPPAVAAVLSHTDADAVLCVDGHQPLLGVDIARRMLAHHAEQPDEARFVFTQAPPGLAGVLLDRQVCAELCEQQWPLGLILSYRPELPRTDPIMRPTCCRIDAAVARTAARLTGDTVRSREILAGIFDALGAEAAASSVCEHLRAGQVTRSGPLPVELELELTTRDPLPNTTLRLRGERIPKREFSEIGGLARILREFGGYDDRLVTLGGHGDPLLHPAFGDVCGAVRRAAILGLCVVTPLVELPDAALHALFDAPVDLVEIAIDAHTAETYRAVHGRDAFATVLSNIERIEAERRRRQSPQPILVPSLTRCAKTAADLESFFDDWIRRTGTAVIRGYDDMQGRLAPDSLLSLTPPNRTACRQLASRLVLLGDGRATACSRDSHGDLAVGEWTNSPLSEIWQGRELQHLRDRHAAGRWGEIPACGACRSWNGA